MSQFGDSVRSYMVCACLHIRTDINSGTMFHTDTHIIFAFDIVPSSFSLVGGSTITPVIVLITPLAPFHVVNESRADYYHNRCKESRFTSRMQRWLNYQHDKPDQMYFQYKQMKIMQTAHELWKDQRIIKPVETFSGCTETINVCIHIAFTSWHEYPHDTYPIWNTTWPTRPNSDSSSWQEVAAHHCTCPILGVEILWSVCENSDHGTVISLTSIA